MPVMLNHINDGKLSLNQLMRLVCENPVKIFGIRNKGFIKEGFDADFTIVDMNKKIVIKNENIESKCGCPDAPFGRISPGLPLRSNMRRLSVVASPCAAPPGGCMADSRSLTDCYALWVFL